ncbi:MAG: hypothetical protein JNL67_00150 [Planctomycetaceae bacterium]|nr:hypothetical protein [Planctomycetaceae bacterium]
MTHRAWTTEYHARRKLRGSFSPAHALFVSLVLAISVGCVSDNPWTSDTTVRVDQPVIPAQVGPSPLASSTPERPGSSTASPLPARNATAEQRLDPNSTGSLISSTSVPRELERAAYVYEPPVELAIPPQDQLQSALEAAKVDQSKFLPVLQDALKNGNATESLSQLVAPQGSALDPQAVAQELVGQIQNLPQKNVPSSSPATASRLVPGDSGMTISSMGSSPPQQMELALAPTQLPAGSVRSTDGLVTISVRDTPLHALLAAVAEQQGLSIVVPSTLNVSITVTLQPTTLENALDAIMAVSNCSWSRTNDVIYVTSIDKETPQNFVTQGRVVKVFNLNHVSAKDVETVVTGLLSPVGRVFSKESAADNKLKSVEQVVVEDLPAYVARVADYIAQADQAPLQALVEVRLLQVRLADENAHGVQLEQLARGAGPEVWLKTQTFSDAANPGAIFTVGGSHFDKVMDLLAKTTDSKTLASPRLLMTNGQESKLQIGSRLAFSTSTTTETATVQAVEFLDVGTVLTVTPQIGENGFILMKINPKVSTGEIDPITKLPNEDTTELNTTILIPDGHGVIIGGLIQESDIERQTKVPLLGDLWLIGRLFQRRTFNRERTEVIVALMPRIVNNDLSPNAKDFEDLGRVDMPLLTPELQSAPRPEPTLPDAIRKPIWPKRPLWR